MSDDSLSTALEGFIEHFRNITGSGSMGFDLNVLRKANIARLPLFKNGKGEPAHSEPDGSDWSLNDWFTALEGEAGELGNLLKKVRRGDFTLEEMRHEIGKELADILIYLDILAFRCGINLAAYTIGKFNEVSDRVGAPVKISAWEAKLNGERL